MGTKEELLALFEQNKGTYISGEDIAVECFTNGEFNKYSGS